MAAINKNFVIKNGIEVGSGLIYGNNDTQRVGLGTTNPTTDVDLFGTTSVDDLIISGSISVANTIGKSNQYLRSTGTGVTWTDFPSLRTGFTTTALGNQTVFSSSGFSYTPGLIDVYVNGTRLRGNGLSDISEFSAIDGSTISLQNPCFGGETIDVFGYSGISGGLVEFKGLTIQEESSIIGIAQSVQTINFVGASVTAIGSGIAVTVYISDADTTNPNYWVSTAAGIHTLSNVGLGTTNPRYYLEVGPVGYADTALWVNGNARVTGILTVGSSSITLDGANNTINVGAGITIDGDAGTITATSIEINGQTVSGAGVTYITAGSGISVDQSTGNVTITATGGGTSSQWETTSAGIHTLSNVGIGTTNPTSALTVTGSGTSTSQLYVTGVSTFRDIISLSDSSSTYVVNARYDQINGFKVGAGYWQDRYLSLSSNLNYILPNVGIGTTNPTSALTVQGNVSVSGIASVGSAITMYAATGIISATTFVGNFSGSITDATNLTGGTANASSLNVSGVATISQGRIQADAASNLRFGNLPAGSGGSGRNIAIGDQVLVSLSGGSGRNIGIGELSYYDTTTGQYNIGIGERAGQKVSTGSYNVILGAYDGNSGNLDIRTSSNNVVIADGQGNIRQYINSSGNVGIKTTVVTEALTVAGIVSATSFYGTLNAGQLTGSLPAIDGSNLIGVIATGTGVEVQEDGTPVGTAGTINFGTNINVSFASGIATVSTSLVGYATEGYVNNAIVGFITSGALNGYATQSYVSTASVAYATTAGISSAVSGTININTSGIITASSFSGSGSGLTNLPAGQLTGTLPAIDGSALLNVTAAGTGIAIRDDNTPVGSAVTVNFGTGLDVTFNSGIATITASGGSLQSRTTVTGVTTSIVNNGIGNTNITGYKSYALMKVGLSTAGWLRLYTDSTSRANDASRSQGIDPSPGSGVIAEVITTGISTTQIISPFVMGGNLDNPADTTIYAAITNLSGSTQAITANLTILQLEA